MPTVLAHFTAQELPGTTAILLTGVAIGLAARSRVGLTAWLIVAATLVLGFVAALADHSRWAADLAGTLGATGWDCVWLAAAGLAVCVAWDRADLRS